MSSPYRNMQAFAQRCFPSVDFSPERCPSLHALHDAMETEIERLKIAVYGDDERARLITMAYDCANDYRGGVDDEGARQLMRELARHLEEVSGRKPPANMVRRDD